MGYIKEGALFSVIKKQELQLMPNLMFIAIEKKADFRGFKKK